MEDFSKVADFVTVYITEAHPTDGWHIPGNIEVANHKWVNGVLIVKLLSY